MSEYLFYYEKVNPVSWAYLSSLLLIGLFFKFNRFWSIRNLDLVLLILLSPGLILVHAGVHQARDAREEAEALAELLTDPSTGQPIKEPVPLRLALASSLLMTSVDGASSEAPAAGEGEGFDPQPDVSGQVEGGLASDLESPAAEGEAAAAEITVQDRLVQLEEDRQDGRKYAFYGYIWLFVVSGLLLVRLLFDPTMVRRPLLEPNLSSGGLVWIGCALFLFLMANVINSDVTVSDLKGAQGAQALLHRTDHSQSPQAVEDYSQFGPGHYALHLIPSVMTTPFAENGQAADPQMNAQIIAAKTMIVLAQLAVVLAMVLIGYFHFENIKMGIGAATIYLMLPYTAQMTGHVQHVLPAALLLWAIVLYRRPAASGILIGLAMSVFYYPFFLLPLWLSFYWQRGVMRFLTGLLGSVAIMVLTLLFVSEDFASFLTKIKPMFGFWLPKTADLSGIWALGWDGVYRLPVIVACGLIAASLAFWPAQKNLGTLLSCTAAVMIAVQFWHAHGDGGGMYVAWYLPLTLLTFFRPNLEDRVALAVLGEDWFTRRKARQAHLQRAA